ncbi:tryptophan synthase subunit alpha [Rhizobacter sp. Root1221]|nr:tryptophan synthase subunit alpha [Rhizobacter sp. Root1221]
MNRFNRLFRSPECRAVIPYFTLGDPTPEASLRLITAAIDAGADAVELEFPFPDPITDGPVNQRSKQRALRAGVTYESCVEMVRAIRKAHPGIPIGLLLCYNLLFTRGDSAYRELADIGVDAVVCPDLPIHGSADHVAKLCDAGLGSIQMAAPYTPDERCRQLIRKSSAFTCVIGTTGANEHLEAGALARVQRLAADAEGPVVVGFGVSKVSQVRELWKAGAHGVIIGSLFSLEIEKHPNDITAPVDYVAGFIREVQAGRARPGLTNIA